MRATVKVENLKIFANHGCMVEESIIGSDYVVNISAVCTLSKTVFDDEIGETVNYVCLLYTSPSPRDMWTSRMPSSA